jgi:hypothetical protein
MEMHIKGVHGFKCVLLVGKGGGETNPMDFLHSKEQNGCGEKVELAVVYTVLKHWGRVLKQFHFR